MSADVYVEAYRKVNETDIDYLTVYNGLIAIGLRPPADVIEYLRQVLGDDSRFPDEEIAVPKIDVIAVRVKGEGNAKYGEGLIIKIADLPPRTETLRIYMG